MSQHQNDESQQQNDNLSGSILLILFMTSLSSTMEVIIECSIGFILAKFKPLKILDRDRIRFLSKLWFNLFIPCLFFINLTTSFSLEVFQQIYMVFLYSIILEILGIVFGKLLFLKWIWKDRLDDVSRTVLTLTLVCHTSVSLPLVYIVALCNVSTSGANPIYNMTFDLAHKSAMTSLSVFIIPIEFVFYTVGYNSFKSGAARLKKIEEESNKKLESEEIINESSETNEVELMEEEHTITEEKNNEEIDEEHQTNQELIIESQPSNQELPKLSTLQKLKLYFLNNWENIKELLRNLLSPPLISIFVAILIALIGPVKDFLITDPPMFISSVKNICKVFSQAVSPAALIILGGNLGMTLLKEENETLSNNSNSNSEETNLFKRILNKLKTICIGIVKLFKIKKIHPLAIAISLITKLIIFPLIGIGLVYAGIYLKILPANDPLLILVVLIQFSMPMAMSLTSLSNLSNDYGQEQVCELLLWHYLLCPLSLSLFSTWFLSLSCQLMGDEYNDKCNI